MIIVKYFNSLPFGVRIVLIPVIAVIAHFVVRAIRGATQWLLTRDMAAKVSTQENFARRFPKFASIITIFISALTFTIYFLAVGLILREFKISLATYLASATVLGLAIGFGLQGFVQDVVIGLTLIFTDALNIEDVVEISGQIGRVEKISLRFTTLINLHGQKIYIPNRNIAVIGRFRGGVIRAYVDLQLPNNLEEKTAIDEIHAMAKGMHQQHKSIILSPPEISGVKEAKPGPWRYIRVKFRLWPGQGSLVETALKQRFAALMKTYHPDYADWMITVAYRVE